MSKALAQIAAILAAGLAEPGLDKLPFVNPLQFGPGPKRPEDKKPEFTDDEKLQIAQAKSKSERKALIAQFKSKRRTP